MSFPMEARNVDPFNEGLSQFYVIVAFTRRPCVVLCIQGVSDWNLDGTHDNVACLSFVQGTNISFRLHFSIQLCINSIVKHTGRKLHAVCILYLPITIFTICIVNIATSYGLDGTVFKFCQGKEIFAFFKTI